MIKSLTSWRFIFAFIIFLHHFPMNGHGVFREGGNLSVSFFFILSGFVLAYSYANKIQKGEVSYRNFVLKRANRIYPVHIFGFIIALFMYLGVVLIGHHNISVKYLLMGGEI